MVMKFIGKIRDKEMTVAELIEKLKTFPQDIPVLIHEDATGWFNLEEYRTEVLNVDSDDFICCKYELPEGLGGEFLAIGG